MKKTTQVTERQVEQAIRRFQFRGGLIKHLPDEVIPRTLLVGARHGRFEPVHYYLRSEGMAP